MITLGLVRNEKQTVHNNNNDNNHDNTFFIKYIFYNVDKEYIWCINDLIIYVVYGVFFYKSNLISVQYFYIAVIKQKKQKKYYVINNIVRYPIEP